MLEVRQRCWRSVALLSCLVESMYVRCNERMLHVDCSNSRRCVGVTAVACDEVGPIPKELGELTALHMLKLSHNSLEGVTTWNSSRKS